MKNKFVVLLGLFVFVFFCIAAIKHPEQEYKNLQVLPKGISNTDLDSVMTGFTKALGQGCDFCHAKNKMNTEDLDFAIDDKPEKEIARRMMKMAEMINKDFFDYTILYKANELMAVSCNTCHKGNPRPGMQNE